MRYKKIKALIFTILLAVSLALSAQIYNTLAAGTDSPDSDFKVSISCGLDGYSKYNSNIPVKLEVTNNGGNFSGKVRIIQDTEGSGSQRIAYTQNILAASGETLELEFSVPGMGISPVFDISIIDDDGSRHFSQRVRTSIQYTEDVYVGILTDDFNGMNYIDGMPFFVDMYSSYISTRIFALDETSFSDNTSVLNSFDAIIINDFDTSLLSDSQYEALKSWVNEGGILLIGTGANYNKTLSIFKNDYLTGSVGQLSTSSADFGLNGYSAVTRSDPIEYEEESQEILEDSEEGQAEEALEAEDEAVQETSVTAVATSDGEENVFISQVLSGVGKINLDTVDLEFNDSKKYSQFLCETLDKGSGKVFVFSFDLGAEPFRSWEYNMQALQNVLTSLTNVSQQGAMRNASSIEYYYVQDMLSNYIAGNLPQIGRFVVIIILYIILVSPAAYFILKKKDKRQWLWVLVPVLACIFTAVIFFFGNSARQNGPYLNYGTVLTSDQGRAVERTYFGVTSPQNKGFEFAVGNGYTVSPLAADYYSSFSESGDNEANDDYDINLTFNSDNTMIDVKNINAFGSKYFLAQRRESVIGTVETDISYVENRYTGTVTNHTGYTLENAFLKLDNSMIYIGLLADGASYEVDSSNAIPISGYYDIPDKVFNEPSEKSRMLSGYMYGLRGSYYSSYTIAPNYAFCAFVSDYPVELAQASGYKNSGSVLLWNTVDVNYTKDGIFSMPNIFYDCTILSGDMDSIDYYFYSDEIKFECYIPSEIKEITNMELVAPGSEEMIYYLYNWESNTYDEVFSNGEKQLEQSQLEPYIQNNCLRIKLEKAVKDTYSSAAFPVISITGREK